MRSLFAQHRILGGAMVLALTQFGASVAGLVRDRMLTSTFPGLSIVDVYIASFRPSDLLFQMTIMAGFSVALVPLLARYKADDDRIQMSGLLSGVIGAAAVAFGLVAVILAVFFDRLAPVFTQFDGETLDLYIRFGKLALLTNFLFVFGNAFGQYLVTVQRYWIYGLTPIIYTLGTIAGTLWLTPAFGAFGPMYGTLGGAVLYVLFRFAGVVWSGYRPSVSLWHPDLREMGWLMLPRMIALGALQAELLWFDRVASGLDAGSVTINAYARNFQSVAVGVAGIALAQSAFSLLSQAAAKKETHRFWVYMRKSIGMLLILTIPGAVALVALTPVAAWLVHLESVLAVFAVVIAIYAVSIPFESINHLLLRSYYALKDTTTPAVFSVINGTAAVALTWFLVPRIGVYAIPAGFAFGQILQLAGLALLLPRSVALRLSE